MSFGDGCGRAGVPGVYTRVSAYAGLIARETARLNGSAAPPAARPAAPVVRIGRISCGTSTCSTVLTVRGREPAGGIALNIVRARSASRKAVDRFVTARRLSATRYVARTVLPYGRVTLYAIPLNASQDDLDGDGDVAEVSISAG